VNRDRPAQWETFAILPVKDKSVLLRTIHGKYLSAPGGGVVNGSAISVGDTEIFKLKIDVKVTGDEIAGRDKTFRSTHGKYLSAQPDGSLEWNRDAVAEWEQFEII
jgi:hypothetical protein